MSLVKDRLRNLMRSAKNSIKDYSPAERRVRAATSNEPWPPSSRMMIIICRDMTDPTVYDSVLVMILKRLQDKGQVMHVRKSLQLVEFCLRHGNSRFVEDMKTRRYIFKGLQSYRFLVHGQDKGAEVRSKAERIMNLLADDSRLEQERLAAKRARSRMQGFSSAMVKDSQMTFGHRSDSDDASSPSEARVGRPPRASALATLPSPSTATSTSDDNTSSSFSASTDSQEVLKPIEPPPRKKITDKKARTNASDSAAGRNRGGLPAIPDNPFDPLSSLFDWKSTDRRGASDWIAIGNENDNGNASRAIQTAKANGGAVAALSHGGSDIKTGPPANVAATVPMDIDAMLMTDVAIAPTQSAKFASSDWYQIQTFRPMPVRQHQQPVSMYANRPNPNRTTPFLALPAPVSQDPNNPFL